MRIKVLRIGLVLVGGALGLSLAPARALAEPGTMWTSAPKKRGPVLALPDLADRARPAVVHVRGTVDESTATDGERAADGGGSGPRTSIGTGFLISKDGYLVSNEHVVRGAADLRVRLYDGRELPACVVGADAAMDIALIKIDPPMPLPVLTLGDSDAVRVGETVVAIGNPYGFNHSVTAGIVSAKERVVDRASLHESPQQEIYSFFIQTDASINLGNSGGPLIDSSGAVIGVSAAFWAGHPLQPAQGIGFAIPINMAKAILPRLRDKGSAPRSYLGIDAQPIDSALEAAFKLPSARGALIASVGAASPAETAGLEPGDVVVTWNGVDVATSEDLKIDAQLSLPGTRVKIGLLRAGKHLEKEAIPRLAALRAPASHPSACNRPREVATSAENDFDVSDVPPNQAGGLAGGRGATISHLSEHGSAAQAGVRVGDILLRIGNERVRAAKDVPIALRAFNPGATVPVLIRRAGFDFSDRDQPEITMAPLLDEKTYRHILDDTFARIDRAFESVDPDVAEVSISQGTLTITFAGNQRCMLTPQPSPRQLWVAFRDRAWHFDYDQAGKRWLDDRGQQIDALTLIEETTFNTAKASITIARPK